MTKEEKAKELVNKHFNAVEHRNTSRKLAKKLALICVDEKIKTLLPYAGLLDIKKEVEELEKVKEEINKL